MSPSRVSVPVVTVLVIVTVLYAMLVGLAVEAGRAKEIIEVGVLYPGNEEQYG